MWPFARRNSRGLGADGETLARRYLSRLGLKILAENYRCPAGEADLVALDKSTRKTLGAETVVFVEVKTRASDHFSDPESAVDADKRRRMRKIANYYLSTRGSDGLNVRFDIVAIVCPPGEEPHIRHIPDAF
jgi:putative endonuclease